MKRLTREELKRIADNTRTYGEFYNELIPYLRDVEETPHPYENIVQQEPKLNFNLGGTTLNVPIGYSAFQHDVTTIPSRLEIASRIMPLLLTTTSGLPGFEWAAVESLRYADELIKQSKTTTP